MSAMSERWPNERVVKSAQLGDPQAISTLIASSHPHVRRFARTLCATPQDAEEAAQEALVILYRKIGTLRATAALGSWMFAIVRHECARRMRLTIRMPEPTPQVGLSTEEAVLQRLEMERVIACIARLPPEQRAVLIMRDIQGLSGAETAAALGIERAAMKSRLHRAREAVRGQSRAPRERPASSG
jgi:RNA polymerase sigma factor (sigma-70 family)